MYIADPAGRLGLHGAAALHFATRLLGPFRLGAASPTCGTLYIIR
jgi:hypothetical protein